MKTVKINSIYFWTLSLLVALCPKRVSSQNFEFYCINHYKLTKEIEYIDIRYYNQDKNNYVIIDLGKSVLLIYEIYSNNVIHVEKMRGICYDDYKREMDNYTLVLKPLYSSGQTMINYIAVEKGAPRACLSERFHPITKILYKKNEIKDVSYYCRFISATQIKMLLPNVYFVNRHADEHEVSIY